MSDEVEVLLFGSSGAVTEDFRRTGKSGTQAGKMYRICGPHQLAWWLREHGFETQVVNFFAFLSDQEVLKLCNKFIGKRTRVVGWSIMSQTEHIMGQTKRFIEVLLPQLKDQYPWVTWITGGPGVHYSSTRYTNKSGFDYYFFGYAENGVLALCNQILRKGPMVPVERKSGNRIVRESAIDIPLDAECRFDIKQNRHRWHKRDCVLPNESLPIEISRGCIFKCKFCAFPHVGKKKGEYVREMESVEEEMLYNYEHFGTTRYYILDDTFNDDADKVKAFYQMTQRLPFDISYGSFMRADLLWAHPDTPYQLKESGFCSAYFGIESFGKDAAEFVGKPWSYRHGKEYLQKLRHEIWKTDVSFRCSMIIGLTGDERKDYIDWHMWFVDNEIPNWSWHPLQIERDKTAPWNSEIDRSAEKFGYTWITENSKVIWKHEPSGLTWRDAMEMYHEMESLKAPYQVNHCFGLMEEVQYCDLDPKVHNFTRIKDINLKEIGSERADYLKLYVDKLLAL